MIKINLNTEEYTYLKKAEFLKNSLKEKLIPLEEKNRDSFQITLIDDQIVELEEAVSTQLQKVGFDIDYNPTKEGKLLEGLIDKIGET